MRDSVRFLIAIVLSGCAAFTAVATPAVAEALPAQRAPLTPAASVRWDSADFGFIFTFTPADLKAIAAGGGAGATSIGLKKPIRWLRASQRGRVEAGRK